MSESRSELRRLAIQQGEPMPEFLPMPPGADHPSAPGAESDAPFPARDGAAAERAIEGVPPSPLAPAPEAQPPALGAPGPSSPSMHPPHDEGGPDSSPEGGESLAAAASPSGSTPTPGEKARADWKAARSANAKAKRNGRGRYPVKRPGDGYGPGMTRRMPPPGGAA